MSNFGTPFVAQNNANEGIDSLILASSSPRRHELLKNLHIPFHIIPSTIEEILDRELSPSELVKSLAWQKAADVYQRIVANPSILGGATSPRAVAVLGADTLVVLEGQMLGKPADQEDAFRMLTSLSGRAHEVYTGVHIIAGNTDTEVLPPRSFSGAEKSKVFFRQLHPREITAYIETGEPMDKAGAYAIQATGSMFVNKIDGCFSNIIGLPIPLVVALLRAAGLIIMGCQS